MQAVPPGEEFEFHRRIEVQASFEPISMYTAFMAHYLKLLRDYRDWDAEESDLKNGYLEFLWQFAGKRGAV